MRKQLISKETLGQVKFFQEFPEKYFEPLAQMADLREYEEGEYLNQRKRTADNFYIVLEGTVSLEIENIDGELVTLETIFPGAAIGFSSLIDSSDKKYLSDARCATKAKALRFRADGLLRLFYQDFELGFLFMRKIAIIAYRRLVYRTQPLGRLSMVK